MFMELESLGSKSNAGAINYDVQLFVKDGKYKINIFNLYHEAQKSRLGAGGSIENEIPDCGNLNMQQRYWIQIKVDGAVQFAKLIEDLKKEMEKAKDLSPDDDW